MNVSRWKFSSVSVQKMALINKIDSKLIQALGGSSAAASSTVQLSTVDSKSQAGGKTANFDAAFTSLRSAFYNSFVRTTDSMSKLDVSRQLLVNLLDLSDRMVKLSEEAAEPTTDDLRRDVLNSRMKTVIRDFRNTIDAAAAQGIDLLDKSEIETILKAAGVDPRAATSLAVAFAKLAGKDGILGYEKVLGEDVIVRDTMTHSVERKTTETVSTTITNWTYIQEVKSSPVTGATALGLSDVSTAVSRDFNGDGQNDIIATTTQGAALLLAGNGDGSFSAAATLFNLGTALTAATAGLIDNDLNADLTGFIGSDLVMFHGNGNGTFAGPVTLSTASGGAGSSLTIADVNADGFGDIFSNGYGTELWLSQGAATWVSSQVTDPTVAGASVGDANGDGIRDIVDFDTSAAAVRLYAGVGDGTFSPGVTIASFLEVGLSNNIIAIGDFTGDTDNDIVLSTIGPAGIVMLEGNGDGSYHAPATLSAGLSGATSGYSFDADGDGSLDLVLQTNSGLKLAYGNGDGTFKAAITLSSGSKPVFASLNGDGLQDLITITAAGDVQISTGAAPTVTAAHWERTITNTSYLWTHTEYEANGTFAMTAGDPSLENVALVDINGDSYLDILNSTATNTALGTLTATGAVPMGDSPLHVISADLNRDGDLDLISANNSGSVSVAFGNGDGSFAARTDYSADAGTYSVAVGDFNEDGYLDVASGDTLTSISIFLANADGSLNARQTLSVPTGLRTIKVGDFNGDNIADLASVEADSDTLSVFIGNGDATFKARRDLATTETPQGISVGDFNNDNLDDILVATEIGARAELFIANSDGSFKSPSAWEVGGAVDVFAADFNNDQELDFVTANWDGATGTTLSLRHGNGDGTFGAPQTITVGTKPLAVAASDMNNDGDADIVVAENDAGELRVLLGNGDGTFQAGATYSSLAGGVAIGDFNGDGVNDVAAAAYAANQIELFLGDASSATADTLTYRLGNGDGTFQALATIGTTTLNSNSLTADVNGDGLLDLVSAAAEDEFSVRLGNGNGSFAAVQTYSTGSAEAGGLSLADFNGDGRADVVLGGRIALANSDGSFALGVDRFSGLTGSRLTAADLNGDTELDLIADNRIYLGNGDGTFGAALSLAASTYLDLKVADITGDGNEDIVVGTDAAVLLFAGAGNGTFASAVTWMDEDSGDKDLAIADFNGDSKLDIAVRMLSDDINLQPNVSILLGNGNAGLQQRVDYDLQRDFFAGSMASGDLDKNGAEDLVIGGSLLGGEIFLGNSDAQYEDVAPYQSAVAPNDPLNNTIRTRAEALVSASQLKDFYKEIKKDLKELDNVLEELRGARTFAISGFRAVDTLKLQSFRSAQEVAAALKSTIRSLALDDALAAHSDLDRDLAKALGL